MLILWPDIHRTLTSHVSRMMKTLGHDLLLPSWKPTNLPPPPVQQWCYDYTRTTNLARQMYGDNVSCVTKEKCLDLKPEVLFITNFESQFEIFNEVSPNIPKSKIAFYSGNNYWDGWFDHNKYQNYIYADTTGDQITEKYNLKNAVKFIPFLHSENPFSPNYKRPIKITSLINDYSKNFNKEYSFFNKLKEITPTINLQNLENQSPEMVRTEIDDSVFGISIKGLEGLGYSNLEFMSAGRPVILHRGCCANKSLLNWSRNYQTCLFFENGAEYKEVVDFILNSEQVVAEMQKMCYSRIRELINSEEQTFILKKFLDNLV